MEQLEKECSKLKHLSNSGAQRLKTASKAYLDTIKMTARNIFGKIFRQFRPTFNNFRYDHVILRELTRSAGFILTDEQGNQIVKLLPAMTLPPKERRKIEVYLAETHPGVEMINDPGKLEREGILLANVH